MLRGYKKSDKAGGQPVLHVSTYMYMGVSIVTTCAWTKSIDIVLTYLHMAAYNDERLERKHYGTTRGRDTLS